MSDYTKTTNFTTKDGLTTGNALKVIKGSYFDTEFDNIATANATKYDSGNLASQAQSEAGTDNATLQTPLRSEQHVAAYVAENGGLLLDIHGLADPGADTLLGWDESANDTILFTVGVGLLFTTTAIDVNPLLAGTGLTMTSSVLDVIATDGLTSAANAIGLTDVAATASNPIDISSGAFSLDIHGLTTIEGNALVQTDTFIVGDGTVEKGIEVQDMGFRVQSAQSTQTLAAADMNTIMEFDATSTLTLPLNSGTALPIGACVIVVVDHATQVVTVTAAASVTLNSTFHPGGGSAASDTVKAGGTAVLLKTATDEWYISGDIST